VMLSVMPDGTQERNNIVTRKDTRICILQAACTSPQSLMVNSLRGTLPGYGIVLCWKNQPIPAITDFRIRYGRTRGPLTAGVSYRIDTQ